MAEALAERLPASRQEAERAGERLVREHRFTIVVVFPLVGAATLLASAEGLLPEPLAFNPYLVLFGTLVMRLPLLVAIAPLVDRRAGLALAGLAGYSWLIELVGVHTGWPYGEFTYLIELGPMLLGEVPLGLPLFFLPLALNAYLLSLLLLGPAADNWLVRLPVAVAAVVAIDLVLDPGAVAIGFWAFADGGLYYGVPASNYAGWVLSGTVAILGFDYAFRRAEIHRRLAECEFALDDLVSFVLLWGLINAAYGNWIPVVVAAGFAVGLARSNRLDLAVWKTASLPGR